MKTEALTRQGIKEGKKPWGLVDFEAMRHLAPHYAGGWQGVNWHALECMLDVLIFGAKKYAPNNWKHGYRISQCIDSLYRHIILLAQGETHDKETGISHYGHILCNLMFMSYWVDHKPELDDRVESTIQLDSYAPAAEPTTEAEAVQALLAVLGGFMNGVDNDPVTELPLLGHAMHYACLGYAMRPTMSAATLNEIIEANKPSAVAAASACACNECKPGISVLTPTFADPETVQQIHTQFNEDRLTNEVRKEALGFSIEPINNGNDFNVIKEQCTDVGERPGCTFPHCTCQGVAAQDHGVII